MFGILVLVAFVGCALGVRCLKTTSRALPNPD